MKWYPRNKDISDIFSRARYNDTESLWLDCGQILQTMYSQIDTPFAQGMLYFCYKDPIATDMCQWHIPNTVTLGMKLLNPDLKISPLLTQLLDYPLCLDHSKLAGSRSYRNLHVTSLLNQINSALLQHTYTPDLLLQRLSNVT